MKRSASIILLLSILLSIAGCGSESLVNENKIPATGNLAKTAETLDVYEDSGDIYERELLMLPDAEVSLLDATISGGNIYLYGTADKEPLLYRMEISTQNFERLEFPQEITAYRISATLNGGICILGSDESGAYILMTLDRDGSWIELLLPMLNEYENDVITQIIPVENGYIVFTSSQILAVDFHGNLLKNLGGYYRYGSCFPLDDGNLIIISQVMDGPGTQAAVKTTVLDTNFNTLESYESNRQFTAFYGSAGDRDHILCRQAGTVFSFNYTDDTVKPVIDVSTSGMSPASLIPLGEELYFSLTNGNPYLWRPYDANAVSTLTLATYMPDINLVDYVNLYNENSTKYKINEKGRDFYYFELQSY